MGNRYKATAKLIISFILIFILFKTINVAEVVANFQSSRKDIIGLAFLILLFSFIVGSFRWGVFISKYKKFSILEILRFSFIGLFYNTFVPGGFAGDIVKGLKTKNIGGGKAAMAVILDRYVGVFSFVVFLFVSLFIYYNAFSTPVWLGLFGFCSLVIGISIGLISKRTSRLVSSFFNKLTFQKLQSFWDAFEEYSNEKTRILYALCIGLSAAFLNILAFALVSQSLNIHLSFFWHFAYIPVIILSSFIPISFRGTGIREFVFIYLYGPLGVENDLCVSISFIYFFLLMLLAVSGGLFIIFSKYQPL